MNVCTLILQEIYRVLKLTNMVAMLASNDVVMSYLSSPYNMVEKSRLFDLN